MPKSSKYYPEGTMDVSEIRRLLRDVDREDLGVIILEQLLSRYRPRVSYSLGVDYGAEAVYLIQVSTADPIPDEWKQPLVQMMRQFDCDVSF
jgi:hypothetical protein